MADLLLDALPGTVWEGRKINSDFRPMVWLANQYLRGAAEKDPLGFTLGAFQRFYGEEIPAPQSADAFQSMLRFYVGGEAATPEARHSISSSAGSHEIAFDYASDAPYIVAAFQQTSGGTIMDYMTTIGAACDLGFRIVLAGKNDQKKLRFEVYRPTADPNNRYSSRWGTLRDASWAFGDSDYCNVAVVQGAGEGTARATVTVGLTDAAGAERREMYVDARDLQPDEESGETPASTAYLERLMARGLNKLLEQTRTGSIEVELEDNALEPGDVAVCSLPELGYKATVRVANIITQSQMDGTTRTVRLGTPVWKKI